MSITYGSLCTGYDGIGMGLRLASVPIVSRWQAEDDDAMSGVLKSEYPGVPNVGDIKAVPWHLAPPTDLMSSGDPCQSISIAGRQAGRDDPRFLWPWVRAAYRELLPTVIFFENVANIVSHDGGRTLGERFAHLREDGYAVRWTVLGACAVGAPHHRHRWYALAVHVGPGAPAAVRMGGAKALCGAPRSGGRWLLPTPNARDGDSRGTPSAEHAMRRILDPARSTNLEDAIAARLLPTPRATDVGTQGRRSSEGWRPQLGQAVLNSPHGLLPTPMAERSGNNRGGAAGREGQPVRPSLDSVHALLPTPIAADSWGTRNATANRSPGSAGKFGWTLSDIGYRPEVWGKYAEAVTLWESITGVPAPDPTEAAPRGGRRLSPLLPEWMMGLRTGLLTDRLGRSDALKAGGNGAVPAAVAAAYQLLSAG